ncbi:MAG: 30S ribosomal protein S2 [Acidobacteriota bacterium]
MATVTMKELLEAGVHFGHLTRKWNPKMKRYIFGQRNGIHIIDLQHTLREFKHASDFVTDLAVKGGRVLFVGTKRQAQEAIREAAERVKMPYVTERWLGGTLTNFRTIQTRIQRYKELLRLESNQNSENLTKKERLLLGKEKEKLEKMLSGIVEMTRIPSAIFVVDIKRERNCIREAKKLGIPVVAMVDTNCDPDEADYPIPGNDDAVRAIQLFAGKVADAIEEGRHVFQAREAEMAEAAALADRAAADADEEEHSDVQKSRAQEKLEALEKKVRRAPSRKAPVRKGPAPTPAPEA